MDVSAWLRSLGLEQYEQAFRDNAIEPEILPKLTAEDLKELGISLVGHRRKLLDAIAALRGAATEPPDEPEHGLTLTGLHHFDLLNHAATYTKLHDWLSQPPPDFRASPG